MFKAKAKKNKEMMVRALFSKAKNIIITKNHTKFYNKSSTATTQPIIHIVNCRVQSSNIWVLSFFFVDKPPITELHQFLEFQLPRQWAPVFSELPLGPQRKQQSCASLQFSFFGPKLYVNTTPVWTYFIPIGFVWSPQVLKMVWFLIYLLSGWCW